MNLPKQSRPVIRDVSRDPIRARVGRSAPVPPPHLPNPCERPSELGMRGSVARYPNPMTSSESNPST
jgi:hypothetical protein